MGRAGARFMGSSESDRAGAAVAGDA